MTTENLSITTGISYLIEFDVERFDELLLPDYVISGQVREASSNALVASFDIVKHPDIKKIYGVLSSDSTRNIILRPQCKYKYDIIAQYNRTAYKLVSGWVNFTESTTMLSNTQSSSTSYDEILSDTIASDSTPNGGVTYTTGLSDNITLTTSES